MTDEEDYAEGMADGLAHRHARVSRLSPGTNRRLNSYERGYIDSYRCTVAQSKDVPHAD